MPTNPAETTTATPTAGTARRRGRRAAGGAAAASLALALLAGCAGSGPEPGAAGAPSAPAAGSSMGASAAAPRVESGARLAEPDFFAQMIADPGRLVINVHVPFEGSIPGTDLAIPYDRIREAIAGGVDSRSQLHGFPKRAAREGA